MSRGFRVDYGPTIEGFIARLLPLLKGDYPFHRRAVALLLLQGDQEIAALTARQEGPRVRQIQEIIKGAGGLSPPPASTIALARHRKAQRIAQAVMGKPLVRPLGGLLDWLTLWPPTAFPILALVLYYGLYRFVGGLGAQILVDFIEGQLFQSWVTPFAQELGARWLSPPLADLVAGDYGMVTLGLRYAVGIILPVVGTFFFFFSFLEDTGYLPRLALLADRACKKVGLSGRAVIPLTLGLGCDTMATVVTRTLETTRERIIATFLLALAVPCSAQLGLILALLGHSPLALGIWVLVVGTIFLAAGHLADRILPGPKAVFHMELPPLRLPVVGNIVMKTAARIQWYLIEITPVFLGTSLLLWFLDQQGLLQLIISALRGPIQSLGLPPDAAGIFLLGFFRRDYGAAGLYDLRASLSPIQLTVAATTLTLFVPCLAQAAVMVKERGVLAAMLIVAIIVPVAFLVGFSLNHLLGSLAMIGGLGNG
ncbi:MAG: ferrous iron transporter B [Firmicutes bacterium]|nr:ferrous iron transporter B [Bacillota bacterium]